MCVPEAKYDLLTAPTERCLPHQINDAALVPARVPAAQTRGTLMGVIRDAQPVPARRGA